MFEWDEDEERWTAVHHPFTRPTDEWQETFADDPGNALAYAYDLIVNGNELGGGSFRIHEPDIQAKVFDLLAMSPEEQRAKFGFLLDALAMGAPPHGGIALGIDRMTMVLAGEPNLRDVIAFPKNQAGLDPMSGAPSRDHRRAARRARAPGRRRRRRAPSADVSAAVAQRLLGARGRRAARRCDRRRGRRAAERRRQRDPDAGRRSRARRRLVLGARRIARPGRRRRAHDLRADPDRTKSLGVTHPVLPCGAKLLIRFGGQTVLTEVIDNKLKSRRPPVRAAPSGSPPTSGSTARRRSTGASPPVRPADTRRGGDGFSLSSGLSRRSHPTID